LCGIALLAGREEFLGLADLGALQVANLGGQALDAGGDDAQRGEIGGVAVARDHLGRDRLGAQPQAAGDMGFDRRVDVGEGANGAGDGAGGNFLAGAQQPAAVARELGVIAGELEAEGHGLGMDGVAAAHAGRVFMLLGAALKGGQQIVDVGEQDVGRLRQLHREAGVEHVRRGHALMHETGLVPDMFGEVGEEGDDVVVGFALDLVDAVDLPFAALPHRRRGLFRDHAQFGLGVAGMGLDLEPDAELVLRLPDFHHFRAAVTGDHEGLLRSRVNARRLCQTGAAWRKGRGGLMALSNACAICP
jgi:hypothetical protein